MATKKERIQKYHDHIAREKSSGVKHHTYYCPHCRFELKTQLPECLDDTWDTLASCPSCDGMYMRVSRHAGVRVSVPGMRSCTNDELMASILDRNKAGPLIDGFVQHALGHYCKETEAAPLGFMDGTGVCEQTWRELAKHVKSLLDQPPLVKIEEQP